MSTQKQIATQVKKEQSLLKQDIISRVTSSIFYLLHESLFNKSTLWPKNGIVVGYGTEYTKSDTVAISVTITYLESGDLSNVVNINIINNNSNRCAKQAFNIDMILDKSVYDNIYYEESWPHDLPLIYKYRAGEWPYKENWHYSQIQFKFTIQ